MFSRPEIVLTKFSDSHQEYQSIDRPHVAHTYDLTHFCTLVAFIFRRINEKISEKHCAARNSFIVQLFDFGQIYLYYVCMYSTLLDVEMAIYQGKSWEETWDDLKETTCYLLKRLIYRMFQQFHNKKSFRNILLSLKRLLSLALSIEKMFRYIYFELF